jgi:acyl-CoA reductase-like NAD-dependent aldehyde dehydrogenase
LKNPEISLMLDTPGSSVEPEALNSAALAFLQGAPKQLLIGGKWVQAQGGKTFETENPETGRIVASVARGEAADIDAAVKAARRAFLAPSWGRITPYQRGNYLLKIADVIEAHLDELATIQSIDMGMLFSQSHYLTAAMVDVFRYFAGWPTKICGQTFPSDGSSLTYTSREPLGVVGAIIPWNGPILASSWKIAPALACGNTIVLKPAEQAPLVSLRLAELIQQTGLPDGVVNIVTGFGEDAGAALVEHPDVNKISFTGSTEVGKSIIRAASHTMKKVTLELGGKSPNVIFADADLAKAIPSAIVGFCAGAGQACVAGSRILIQESIFDEVAAQIAAGSQALAIGSPFASTTQLGPLASREQFDRVTGYIKLGQSEGATISVGGSRSGDTGYFVQPTVFTGVQDTMRIVREEIFGPVSALMSFTDEADAIAKGNDTSFGLAASVWTKDISKAHSVAHSLEAGIVWLNTIFELDPMAPFGGYKQSGAGRELGAETIDAHSQTKTIVLRL